MKYRRHHNNKGFRQIKEGKTRLYIEYLKNKLHKIIEDNKMEQTTETQDRSYAQQLVDEYYGHYKSVKPSEAELPNILGIFEFMLDKFYYHNGINLEPIKDSKMTVERIKEIQLTTGYPDSVSVQQALLQVWNEVEQASNQVQAAVKPACGNCINCIHFVDIDIQKDLQSACTHKNITVEWVENPEEFGCIYFESKSV
jgi:hypothetical protein